MKYKVSVIVPVFNAEKTVKRALDSVRKQTIGFGNIELIVVNDCSNDGSAEILNAFEKKYENICVINTQINSGDAGVPRNIALERVSAPYVMFVDSDDELEANACEVLIDAIENSRADLATAGYSIYGENGKKMSERIPAYDEANEGVYDLSRGIACFEPLTDPFWCKIYKSEIIKENGVRFSVGYTGEDTAFTVRYLLCSKSAYYKKTAVYRYYMTEGSMSRSKTKDYFINVTSFYKDLELMLGRKNAEFYNRHLNADHFLHLYSTTGGFVETDTREVLKAWWHILQYTADKKLVCHSPAVRTIVRDAAVDDFEGAVYHMGEFRAIEDERRRQLEDIFSSKSWKLSKSIADLFKTN